MKKDYENIMPYDDGWKKKSGPLGFRMCNDYLFRAFLQRDEESLKALIAAFLQTDVESIGEIVVTNPIILGEEVSEKELHLDIHVVVAQGFQMDFEMQLARHSGWVERSILYVCRCVDSISHGDDYRDVPGIWQIAFCDFCLFPDHPSFYSNFMLINTEDINHIYSDKLRLSNIDLTNIELATDRDRDAGIVKWARLFKAQTWEDLKMLAEDDKTIDRAVSSAWQLTEDARVYEQIRRREENERLWNSMVRRAEEAEAAEQELAAVRQETEKARQETEAARQETEAAKQETEAARQAAAAAEESRKMEQQRADQAEEELKKVKKQLEELMAKLDQTE